MSEDRERMSSEDKFLGVRTTIVPPEPDSEGLEAVAEEVQVQVVDDRPEEDQRFSSSDEEDPELQQYGKKVEKRIKKLKYDFHSERRAKESAEKLSNEAINYTQNLQVENQRLLKLINNSQSALEQQSKYGADAALVVAQESFRNAHESGDSDQILTAQKALTEAQFAQASSSGISRQVVDNWKQEILSEQRQTRQAAPIANAPAPEPDAEALEWQQENSWFGTDKEMTSFAYGVHERLISDEGVDPNTPEYYELIDQRMKAVFPTHFSRDETESDNSVVIETVPRRKASTVVAPAARNNGAVPRKVTLTSTQVSLAKRLGLTPQQYAQQLIKEMS
tara:strand:+ start:1169 stop:2176 length:1008 start_codon:yes stop_codon:yes gene_type:complete